MLTINLLFANMANPWIYGSQTSTFISSQNMDVKSESINIQLFNGLKQAFYNVAYEIMTDSATTIPLLFIAENYDNNFSVLVNSKKIDVAIAKNAQKSNLSKYFNYLRSESENEVYVLFDNNDSLLVRIDDIIQFDAILKKGYNKIEVAYEANNSFNRSNWFVEPEISYSLYPSRFWRSFKDITLNISADEKFKIVTSNIGMPVHSTSNKYNANYSWQFKNIPTDIISIKVSPKISIIANILIYLDPIGIAFILTILFVIMHIKSIKARYKHQIIGFNKPLWLGNFLVPILFIIIYFLSYNLIDTILGIHAGHFHGYYFLIVVILPFLWVIYSIIIWIVSKIMYRKYNMK